MSRSQFDKKQVLLESDLSQLRKANGQYDVDIIFSSGWVDASVAREA